MVCEGFDGITGYQGYQENVWDIHLKDTSLKCHFTLEIAYIIILYRTLLVGHDAMLYLIEP